MTPRLGWIVGLRDPATGEYGNITVTGDDGRFAFRYVAARPWDFVAIQGTPSLLDPPFDMEDPAWHVPALQIITPNVVRSTR